MTVDNLAARGMQHNTLCPLCNLALEHARYLLINCPFSKEVLDMIWSWFGMSGTTSSYSHDEGPASWLCSNAPGALMSNQEEAFWIRLYVWRNVWKE
jgi:hypothetical protein